MRVKIGETTIERICPIVDNGTGIDYLQARAARQFFDLSAEFVADKIGITPQLLLGIEEGHATFEVIVAKALKKFYEKQGAVFTDGSGIQRKPSGA